MNIVQQIWEGFQRVLEVSLLALEKGIDFLSFQEKLCSELNRLGQEIVKEVLEAGDSYLYEHREERSSWEVERKDDTKEILTIFGPVRYKRTYYRHKETGERTHLVDRLAGYKPHERVDPLVKAQALEVATELSYRKSGEEIVKDNREVVLSGEAVKKIIHNFEVGEGLPEPPKEKRRCEVLYVEADEDHVAGQDKKRHLPRLVYVYEGKERAGKDRVRLKNPYYFSGLYPDTQEIWLTILDYLEEHYDISTIKRIYLCGDGDPWIKKGLEFLPNSVFVLDLFHLDKYLTAALQRDSEAYRRVWEGLREGDQVKVEAVLKEAERTAVSPTQRKAVRACRRYIRNNWDGIMAYQLYPEAKLGVSAEGHISHVLSARLSSRPMAWSAKGVDHMARLRAMKANGISVREVYINKHRQELKSFKVSEKALKQEWERLRKVSGEVYDNLPALRGPVSQLTKALKALSRDISLIW